MATIVVCSLLILQISERIAGVDLEKMHLELLCITVNVNRV